MLTQTNISSLPHGSTTWTLDNNVYVEPNMNTKFYQGLCPHVLKHKKVFGASFKRPFEIPNDAYIIVIQSL